MDAPHKYFCTYCERNILGHTSEELADHLNVHNQVRHPSDFDKWTGALVVKSSHYIGPNPEESCTAIVITGPDWGNAKAPVLTDADRAMLAEHHILWD